jgi:hypothetical protein
MASAVCGVAMLWVLRRTADLTRLRIIRKRLQAHLLEFRLYYDEPSLIWRAQKALIADNLRLLLLLLRPALILALPMAWLLAKLDLVYGYAPLPVGASAIVTAQLNRPLTSDDANATLQAPPAIQVETAAVQIPRERQLSWRIRPVGAVIGALRVRVGGDTVEKTIAVGDRPLLLRRRGGQAGAVAWIEISYPDNEFRLLGWRLPWVAWFFLLSGPGVWTAASALTTAFRR